MYPCEDYYEHKLDMIDKFDGLEITIDMVDGLWDIEKFQGTWQWKQENNYHSI